MYYDPPDYLKNWRTVDSATFEEWLKDGSPDYIVRGRYFVRDYFTRHGDHHFASVKKDGSVIVDPAYLA